MSIVEDVAGCVYLVCLLVGFARIFYVLLKYAIEFYKRSKELSKDSKEVL